MSLYLQKQMNKLMIAHQQLKKQNFILMKTLTISLLFLGAIFFISSCKKEEKEKTTQEKITGKWNVISKIIETTIPSEPVSIDTLMGTKDDYIDFRSDGKLSVFFDGLMQEGVSYVIENDTMINLEGEPFNIRELNNTKFVFDRIIEETKWIEKTTFILGR